MLATFSSVADSLAKFAWPVLAAVVLVLLWPEMKRVLRSRAFTVKVGSFELTAQDASEQVARQIQDLQTRMLQLEGAGEEVAPVDPQSDGASHPDPFPRPIESALDVDHHTILWVDDNPSNNAFETASLIGRGWTVEWVSSTNEALRRLGRRPRPAVLITDVGREADGHYDADAGPKLIVAARSRYPDLPIVVYTSSETVGARADELRRLGVMSVTDSPSSLLTSVVTADAMQMDRAVGAILRDSDRFVLERVAGTSSFWDFVGRFDGRVVVVEVLASRGDLRQRVRLRVDRFEKSGPEGELWIVTRESFEHDQLPDTVRRFTVESLRRYVA